MIFADIAAFRRAFAPAVLVLACALALGGCQRTKEALGLTKQPPDEFNVVSRAPLTIPANLEVLPAPDPGAQRPQELQPQEEAIVALFGQQPSSMVPVTRGEQMIVAGAVESVGEPVPPGIRQTVNQEDTALREDTSWMQDLQFWRDFEDPTAVVINPYKEEARIQEAMALGQPIAGDSDADFEAVIIKPEEKALLEDIF